MLAAAVACSGLRTCVGDLRLLGEERPRARGQGRGGGVSLGRQQHFQDAEGLTLPWMGFHKENETRQHDDALSCREYRDRRAHWAMQGVLLCQLSAYMRGLLGHHSPTLPPGGDARGGEAPCIPGKGGPSDAGGCDCWEGTFDNGWECVGMAG